MSQESRRTKDSIDKKTVSQNKRGVAKLMAVRSLIVMLCLIFIGFGTTTVKLVIYFIDFLSYI